MLLAGSVLLLGFRAKMNTVARKRPRINRDNVSCWNGCLGTYAKKSNIAANLSLKVATRMSKNNTRK